MTLQERIKSDLKEAMKSGNTERKNLLRVVIGEFNRIGKELSDDVATKEIKKMHTNATELGNVSEAEILNEYIPQELSEERLRMIVSNLVRDNQATSIKDMGIIMNELKENYPNQYDGKLASAIVRETLV